MVWASWSWCASHLSKESRTLWVEAAGLWESSARVQGFLACLLTAWPLKMASCMSVAQELQQTIHRFEVKGCRVQNLMEGLQKSWTHNAAHSKLPDALREVKWEAETLGQETGEDGCSDQLSHIGVHGDCLGEAKQYINAVHFTVVICILEPTPSTYCNTCCWTKAWELCLWTDSLVSSPFSLFSLGTGPIQNRGVN